MAHNKKFLEAYARLNTEQKLAVDSVEGPVMVIAGPGTGKTQILTLRIAKILLETDTKPESILALTFTESGVKAMRERLRQYIGQTAYKVPVMTFHGFADHLIQTYPDDFEHLVGSVPVSDLERIQCIETIVDSGLVTELRPAGDPYYYVSSLIQQISDMKREYVTPETLSRLLDEEYTALSNLEQFHTKGAHKGKERSEYKKAKKQLEKNQALLTVYRLYQNELKNLKRYDFEDMILEAVSVLETNESIRLDVQERYQYVLADEHQDVNHSQNKILQLITEYHHRPNIFVVGDEKQAIYRFQGASLENFLFFEDCFPGTKTISLTQNYRSNQTVLDYAHHMIRTDDESLQVLRVPLIAASEKVGGVSQTVFVHEHLEIQYIFEQISKLAEQGVSYNDMAIIVRTNREVELYTREFRMKGLNVSPSADSDINVHPLVRAVRALLTAIIDPADEGVLFEVLHGSYWNFTTADIIAIITLKNSEKLSLSEILFSKEKDFFHDDSLYEKVIFFREIFILSREKLSYTPLDNLIGDILRDSGLIAYAHKQDPVNGFRVIRRLLDAVDDCIRGDKTISLKGVVDEFKRHEQYGIPLNVPYIPNGQDAVHIMTAHKSKGLEFPVVFVANVTDKKWGGKRVRDLFKIKLTKTAGSLDVEDDDRRLLYVAVTRAKQQLFVSYSQNNLEGAVSIPSRLIDIDKYQFQESLSQGGVVPIQVSQEVPFAIPYEYLTELFLSRGLSATALNNYLSSPWTFLYRNLLRIPEVQPLHMKYGTVVHYILERAVKRKNEENKLLTTGDIDVILRSYLKKMTLTITETTQLHEKALEAVPIYLEKHFHKTATVAAHSVPEYRVVTDFSDDNLLCSSLKLTGSLDRVDYDGEGTILRVTDYKTGKAKSRNAIEGNTKDADGSYKRQLVFYALLLKLQGLYHDQICFELSFVEPAASGNIVSHEFYINEDDINNLKGQIVLLGNEIIQQTFLNTPCDENQCDYCDYAKLLVDR